MPRLIDPGAGAPIGLNDLIEALATTPFDVRDEESFASLGPLLARLGRNRDFLADLAIAELKQRCAGQVRANGYGAQVFLLAPPDGRTLLRANFWPARDAAIVRASGTAAFLYDMPHDHHFPFLTHGYLGPGYWSDYYEYDADACTGVPGEVAGMRFVERARLEPDRVMLYRPGRDIHVQLPPDAFSVSLNILGADAAQPWRDQYRFDTATGTICESLTSTAGEALLTLAVHVGSEGVAVARDFARRHPVDRVRVTALDALASVAPDCNAVAAIWEDAADAASAHVTGQARLRLAGLNRTARS